VKSKAVFEPQLDLIEIRRQLIAIRSRYSDNRRVTRRINGLIGELAHLLQPDDRAHEKRLIKMISHTKREVERLTSGHEPAASASIRHKGATGRSVGPSAASPSR
jgi:hypothetical protein